MEVDEFERHRAFLMGLAYRMLGSSAEAEDAVQDTSAFLAAMSRGDVDAISSVMAEDITLVGDHAEDKRGAILRPIEGRANVARFFASQVAKMPSSHGLEVEITDVNGWPALVGRRGGAVTFVMSFETDGTKLTKIRSVLNPQKLQLPHVS
jgi:ketosteroid isomerase-like protein